MKTILSVLLMISVSGSLEQLSAKPLPTTLWKLFTATNTEMDIQLSWVTINETNSVTYYIQHSKDGLHWSDLDTIVSESVNFTDEGSRFMHRNPGSGDHYYRILTKDIFGFDQSSPVRKITRENTDKAFRVLENPINGKSAKLDCTLPVRIKIIDPSGKLVLSRKLETGINSIDLGPLQQGLYIISAGGSSRKVIVN